jgi:hypothetical protein
MKAGLAALPGAALSRGGVGAGAAWPSPQDAAVSQVYAGFPSAARQWHGDSSVGAALKSGAIPAGSPLEGVARSIARSTGGLLPRINRETLERDLPEDFAGPRALRAASALRRRFPDFHRHFVFEYYAWYQTAPWAHWSDKGHNPPHQIASTMVPALGPYDSLDAVVIEQHARWMADAGVGAIAISWWGQDSYSNRATPLIMDVMRAHDIHVTFHLEPYRDDRALFYASDINYLLREYGERRRWDGFLLLQNADGSSAPVFKTFRTIVPPTIVDCQGIVRTVPDYTPDAVWRRQTDAIRENTRPVFDRVLLLADSLDVGRTAAGGFDGISIYDSFVRPETWAQAATDFGAANLLYSFAVNAGFDSYIPVIPAGVCDLPQPFEPPIGAIDWTNAGARLAAEAASRARVNESLVTTLELQSDPARRNAMRGFFLTYITTFNEWHEGTSFEPARNRADLRPEERAFNYHNPDNGAWRHDLLRQLMQRVTG